MTESDFIELIPQLDAFHKRFQGFFCRSEGRKWSMKYLQGLMMPIERKKRGEYCRGSCRTLLESSRSF